MSLYIGKGIRFVILPESCNKAFGGYWRENIYYPEIGYYYGYIKPRKPTEPKGKEGER